MRLRHFVTRWLGALGLILSLVGLISQGATSAQTPLAETQQSPEQGDAAAQYSLGLSYDYGLGVQQDDARAVLWYRIAADQGHAAAQYNLGVMYRSGQGVPQDFTEAVAWFRQAADQGHGIARYKLGVMYINGEGVPQGFTEAVAWFRQAADEGDVAAQYNLGVMYARQATGLISWLRRSTDYVEAHMWFSLAASHVSGPEQRLYAEIRDETARELNPAQLAEAQKRAAEWQAAFEQRQDERLLGFTLGSQQP